jgi:conjugative relaxase-like TrwC/TraI family protein
MTISASRISSANYFLNDVIQSFNYYATKRSGGIVLGSGASKLGLTVGAKIQRAQYSNLLRGCDPNSGRQLVKTGGKHKRRFGWDVTVTVDQSVSAFVGIAPKPIQLEVERCAFRALRIMLSFLDLNAGETRRGQGGAERESAPLTFVVFQHATSRPVDGRLYPSPMLHWHCLNMNTTCRADGTFGTLDSRRLYAHLGAASRLFNVELAKLLEKRLGLELERTDSGFRIAGVPKVVDKYFSVRRKEMLDFAGGVLTSPAAATKAAIKTRRKKVRLPPLDVLRDHWAGVAKEQFGFGRDEAEALCFQKVAVPKKDQVLAESLERALARITEREAHFSQRELLKYTAEEALCRGGVGAKDVQSAVTMALAKSPAIVPLGLRDGDIRFTTPEMLTLERELFATAGRLQGSNAHAAPPELIEAAIGRERKGQRASGEVFTYQLNDEQTEALRHIAGGCDLSLVLGLAGAGKTTTLAAFNDVCEARQEKLIGLCLAGIAAQGLSQTTGMSADTVAMFLTQAQPDIRHPWLDDRTTVVIDEAAQLGTKQLNEILQHIERAGSKAVLVGDHRQLQAISAGNPFRSLAEELGAAQLKEITRQRDQADRQAVLDALRGRSQKLLQSHAERGLLAVEPTREVARQRLIDDWVAQGGLANPKDHLIIAHTRREVAELNAMAQSRAHAHSGGNNLNGIDCSGVTIAVGDRIQFGKRRRSEGIENGDLATVKLIDAAGGRIAVELDRHDVLRRPISRTISVLDWGLDLRLGWATTNHAAQGATREQVYAMLGGSGMQDLHATYVQISRARGATRLYVDELEAGEELRSIARQMARERPKEMAHDVRPSPDVAVESGGPTMEAFLPSARPRPHVVLERQGSDLRVYRVIAIGDSRQDAERELQIRSAQGSRNLFVSEWVSRDLPTVGSLTHSAHDLAAPSRQEIAEFQAVIIKRGWLGASVHSVHPTLDGATRQMEQIIADRAWIRRSVPALSVRSVLPGEDVAPQTNLLNAGRPSLEHQQLTVRNVGVDAPALEIT